MNEQDLLRMLDITPSNVPSTDIPSAPANPLPTTDFEATDYAFCLDEWDIERGKQAVLESRHFDDIDNANEVAADFYAAYWQQNPVLDEQRTCVDAHRAQFLRTLLSTPEYRELHASTVHSPYETAVAVSELAQAYAKTIQSKKESNDKDNERNATDERSEPGKSGMGVEDLVAVAKAVRKAQEQVDEAKEIAKGLGWDTETANGGQVNTAEMMKRYAHVKDNPAFRRVLELAGRYRRCAQSQQRNKTGHGQDEFVGVEMDSDVSRLLPVELGRLGDEDLELDMLRRFAERQTLCREYASPEPQGHGPIVVCVDESGSMRGERIAQAKAFALAMAWIARHQKRYCLLVAFSSSSTGRTLCLKPGAWDQDELVSWITSFLGGGTSFECPLRMTPSAYWAQYDVPKGKTDMVLITDGIAPISPKTRDFFNDWKVDEKCTLTTLVIGDHNTTQLEKVSDKVYSDRNFDLSSEGVRECLSV